MIQRFEDEYPDAKDLTGTTPSAQGMPSPDPSVADMSLLSASVDSGGLMKTTSAEDYFPPDSKESYAVKLSRTSSNTSLAAKAITDEEGRMHRLGQTIRREVLRPTGKDDNLNGTSTDDEPESARLAAIRAKFEEIQGEDIRAKVEREGPDSVLRELGLNVQELLTLRERDPDGFEAFRNSQMAAQINSGLIDQNGNAKEEA